MKYKKGLCEWAYHCLQFAKKPITRKSVTNFITSEIKTFGMTGVNLHAYFYLLPANSDEKIRLSKTDHAEFIRLFPEFKDKRIDDE